MHSLTLAKLIFAKYVATARIQATRLAAVANGYKGSPKSA